MKKQEIMQHKAGPVDDHTDEPVPIIIPRKSVWTNVWTAVGFAGFAVSVALVVIFAYDRVNTIEERLVEQDRAAEIIRQDLLDQVEAQDVKQAGEDCRNLYEEAVIAAATAHDITKGRLFIAHITTGLTAEERDTTITVIRNDLVLADAALLIVTEAFNAYVNTDPPPLECPHPSLQ